MTHSDHISPRSFLAPNLYYSIVHIKAAIWLYFNYFTVSVMMKTHCALTTCSSKLKLISVLKTCCNIFYNVRVINSSFISEAITQQSNNVRVYTFVWAY